MTLVHVPGGPLLLPAEQVTDLLRRLATCWLDSAGAGESDLEAETVEALADSLTEVADRIDTECIGLMPFGDGGGGGDSGSVAREG
ncbi:DUF6213 family protein [Streptomyces sp. NPDC059083]|uniref:DUF6213 family protein n=1 Tax=unclassified Streptomyces TaxID=2593676 RepID=UPI0036AB0E21